MDYAAAWLLWSRRGFFLRRRALAHFPQLLIIEVRLLIRAR